MTFRRIMQGAGVLLVIAAAIGWLSGGFESKIQPGGPGAPVGGLAPDVQTATVERLEAPAFEWASGTVLSARRTTVASRILASIEEVRVAAGDDVAAGDVLVTLDDRDLIARVAQASESVKAAQAQEVLARSELDRANDLLSRGVGTRQRYDQALSGLQVARAEVDRMRLSLGEAETALSYTKIRAPVAGRVIDRLAEPGDTVGPGQSLLRLYDPEALRIEAPVRETLAVRLKVGDTLRVQVPALGETMSGPIDEIVPFAESGARTLLVKIRLSGGAKLFAGLYARVAIPAGKRLRLLVPAEAVTRIGQLEFVNVIEDTGVVRRMVTSAERLEDGRLNILSGLSSGERVVVGGNL